MKHEGNFVSDLKIAYVGGGSRGWAWGLMSDLASASDITGEVRLYDIDREAAEHNKIIGEKFASAEGAKSHWDYVVSATLDEALTGADFVVVSILPGTFDEMESDVHTPEKYGIYQSVGDTAGPGGIVRALRALPMIEEIALGVKRCCPDAWVINYTNPMTVITKMFYVAFPQIKAFGCCHEVFGTQRLIAAMVKEKYGLDVDRSDIKVEVTGVNHFTWLTKAQYKNIDLFPMFAEFSEKYAETGYLKGKDTNWMNNVFDCSHKVKFDLFRRYGYIAAAGDRHLAEFCEGKWYLKDEPTARSWGFSLTSVAFRKKDLQNRLERSRKRMSGEEKVVLEPTGEEGVEQIRALLGLHTLVTNVNLPNVGQIPNLPMGAVVETNAVFSAGHVTPVMAGPLPKEIYPLVTRVVGEQELVVEAAAKRDADIAFKAFANDPLVTIPVEDARKLYKEMLENTKKYLSEYNI